MTRIDNIRDSESSAFTAITSDDFEYVKPVYQLSIISKTASIEVPKSLFKLKGLIHPVSFLNKLRRQADNEWQIKFQIAVGYKLPEGLNGPLEIDKKREQERALKDLTLDAEMYFAFLIQAGIFININ